MISYQTLCMALQDWKAKQRDSTTDERVEDRSGGDVREQGAHGQVSSAAPLGRSAPSTPGQSQISVPVNLGQSIWRHTERTQARITYHRMLLGDILIPFDGLWAADTNYFILCPDKSMVNAAERSLERHHSSYGPPISIVTAAPQGAIRVSTRDSLSIAPWAHNWDEVYTDLAFHLPRNLPHFHLQKITRDNLSVLQIRFRGSLTPQQSEQVRSILQNYRHHPIVDEIETDLAPPSTDETPASAAISPVSSSSYRMVLHSSRQLRSKLGKPLNDIYERDEDAWRTHRRLLASPGAVLLQDVLPEPLATRDVSRCMVDCQSCDPGALSNYTLMYDQTVLCMPSDRHLDTVLRGMDVNSSILVRLARLGRIFFLLPRPLHFYRLPLLQDLASEAPHSLVFSRSLLTASVAESVKRLPFLYPPADAEAKRDFIYAYSDLIRNTPEGQRLALFLARGLADVYYEMDESMQAEGAMALRKHGLGTFANSVYQGTHQGHDLFLEFQTAGMAVQWAACLDAVLYPFGDGEYSLHPICESFAGLYAQVAGMSRREVLAISLAARVKIVQEELLSSELPSPLAQSEKLQRVSKADLREFRRTISEILASSTDDEDLRFQLERLGHAADLIEARAKLLTWGGHAINVALAAGEMANWISGVGLINAIAAPAIEMMRRLGWDERAISLIMGNRSDAVIVARMRKTLGR